MRVQDWTAAFLTTGSYTNLLTPPAGRKYEVIQVSVAQPGATAVIFRPALLYSGTFWGPLDEFSLPSTISATSRGYQSLLVKPGFSFGVGEFSAGSVGSLCVVTYIDAPDQ